jgi:suppressor of fused
MYKSSHESEESNELDPITACCLKIYPDQKNVLQAVSQTKYWTGGQDPIDYINIYINNEGTTSYFHYVSLGLSDLYGDERLFKILKNNNGDHPSGYGFELTIKVKINQSDEIKNPPTWPFKLMQSLARYIYNGGT